MPLPNMNEVFGVRRGGTMCLLVIGACCTRLTCIMLPLDAAPTHHLQKHKQLRVEI